MHRLSRHLKPHTECLNCVAAATMILMSSYLCGASVVDGQRRRAEIAFLLFIAAVRWQRSVFQRRAGRDATNVKRSYAGKLPR